MKKRILSALLAAALAVGLAAPAFAAENKNQTVSTPATAGDVQLNGKILGKDEKLLSVTMPVSIDFVVSVDDNEKFAALDTTTDETYRSITSNSNADVKVEVSAVQAATTGSANLLGLIKLALFPNTVTAETALADGSGYRLDEFVGTATTLIDTLSPKATCTLNLAGAATAANLALTQGDYTVVATLKVSFVPDTP